MDHESVRRSDPAVADALDAELTRQRETLSLIASENHVSEAVLEAQGSVLTNKYAEGTPGDRYYAGCEYADEVERLAIDRAKELWGAEHVNVQPHSGTQANLCAYAALLAPGDRILSLDLAAGGHLSHGHRGSAVSDYYEVEHYEVDPDTGYIDYDALRERALETDPDLLVAGFSAYPREVEWGRMREAADAADAHLLADVAHITGLVAAGGHASPVGVADVVTGSTHKTIRAGRGGIVMTGAERADAVDRAVMPGLQGGPLMHNVAGKAVGFREALEPEFEAYAARTVENAVALAGALADRGLSIVSGGTDLHFALVDLRDSHPDLTGERAARALADAGIVLNASPVPGETRASGVWSGIRAGTPALATRGFDAGATVRVADCIAEVLDAPGDEAVRERAREEVRELCAVHPLY